MHAPGEHVIACPSACTPAQAHARSCLGWSASRQHKALCAAHTHTHTDLDWGRFRLHRCARRCWRTCKFLAHLVLFPLAHAHTDSKQRAEGQHAQHRVVAEDCAHASLRFCATHRLLNFVNAYDPRHSSGRLPPHKVLRSPLRGVLRPHFRSQHARAACGPGGGPLGRNPGRRAWQGSQKRCAAWHPGYHGDHARRDQSRRALSALHGRTPPANLQTQRIDRSEGRGRVPRSAVA